MSSKKEPEVNPAPEQGFSRRGFLRGAGATSGALGAALLDQQEAAAAPAPPPVTAAGEASITLNINGKPTKVPVEPRTTLLDALRDRLELTGAKRVCDRGTCGACTVLVNGKTNYACSVLAIDVQGKSIQTIESLTAGGKSHPLIPAFANQDGLQCGYCTPGMMMAAKGLLDKTPKPTYEQIKAGLGGNICRCGTYVGLRKAVQEASGTLRGGNNA